MNSIALQKDLILTLRCDTGRLTGRLSGHAKPVAWKIDLDTPVLMFVVYLCLGMVQNVAPSLIRRPRVLFL